MAQVFPDTPPETERVLFAMLREMPAWRKPKWRIGLLAAVGGGVERRRSGGESSA
jgi:hypothetical protein